MAFPERHQPYPTHKDSGVQWLGKIPTHWKVQRLKHVATWNDEALPDSTDAGFEMTYVDIGSVDAVRGIVGKETLTFDSAPSRARRIVRHGDVVISAVRTYLRAISPIIEPETNLIVSTGFVVLRPRLIDSSFASYAVRAPYFVDQVVANSLGVSYPAINPTELVSIGVVCPSDREQRAIAAFLDRETAKIDALVAKKERLIELLQEKRSALITRAVTKGLDGGVPVKDTGIEWLGEIPFHWEVAPVYARYEVALGKMLDAKRISGNYLGQYIRNVDVQWDSVNTADLPQMDFSPQERNRYKIKPGDLLVCEGGEVGRTAIWQERTEECFYQKALHRVRPRSKVSVPRFFFYVMYSLAKRGVFMAGGNPNTIDHLTAIQLSHYRFAFPPADEQIEIATFLDRETARIDVLLSTVRGAIAHLKELREALISAAVTGKIDVRDDVGPNPEPTS